MENTYNTEIANFKSLLNRLAGTKEGQEYIKRLTGLNIKPKA